MYGLRSLVVELVNIFLDQICYEYFYKDIKYITWPTKYSFTLLKNCKVIVYIFTNVPTSFSDKNKLELLCRMC